MQGKTQLFPAGENDFFRNRLTHSLEVAQVAKAIATRLNHTHEFFRGRLIELDLIELAALAHDIGHPPFGHNGEHALDQIMMRENAGGFEGNAQTLRILSRIEKKQTLHFPNSTYIPKYYDESSRQDLRIGLNLSFRSLASVLKYDRVIESNKSVRERNGNHRQAMKGYYEEERDLVSSIKEAVGFDDSREFKTIECSIMDVADDIAYSTYDLEDCFKGGFMSPIQMVSMDAAFKEKIAEEVADQINQKYPDASDEDRLFMVDDVDYVLHDLFFGVFSPEAELIDKLNSQGEVEISELAYTLSSSVKRVSSNIEEIGFFRTELSSYLIGQFIRDIEVMPDEHIPALTVIRLGLDTFKKVETLKRYCYRYIINSSQLKITETKGSSIIETIFDAIRKDESILPKDWLELYKSNTDPRWQTRVICDFIAGMTDRYCLDFYSKVTGPMKATIYGAH